MVARQLGKVCLVGCAELSILPGGGACRIGEHEFKEGDWLTLDGNAGLVFSGRLAMIAERPESRLAAVRHWWSTERPASAAPATARSA